jgi:hypothetical protein
MLFQMMEYIQASKNGIGQNGYTSTGGLGNTCTAVSTHPPSTIPLRPAHALEVMERSAYCPYQIDQK